MFSGFLLYIYNLSQRQTRFRFFEQNFIIWHSVSRASPRRTGLPHRWSSVYDVPTEPAAASFALIASSHCALQSRCTAMLLHCWSIAVGAVPWLVGVQTGRRFPGYYCNLSIRKWVDFASFFTDQGLQPHGFESWSRGLCLYQNHLWRSTLNTGVPSIQCNFA